MFESEANLSPDPGQPEPSLPTSSAPSRKEVLELEKLEAERDKARAERDRLTGRGWRFVHVCAALVPVASAFATVAIAIIGLFVSWRLGVFNVAEERTKVQIGKLEAQKASLDFDVKALKQEKDRFEEQRAPLSNEIVKLKTLQQTLTEDTEAKSFLIAELRCALEETTATNQMLLPLQREIERVEKERELTRVVVKALDEDRGTLYGKLVTMSHTNDGLRHFLMSYDYGRPAPPTGLRLMPINR